MKGAKWLQRLNEEEKERLDLAFMERAIALDQWNRSNHVFCTGNRHKVLYMEWDLGRMPNGHSLAMSFHVSAPPLPSWVKH